MIAVSDAIKIKIKRDILLKRDNSVTKNVSRLPSLFSFEIKKAAVRNNKPIKKDSIICKYQYFEKSCRFQR